MITIKALKYNDIEFFKRVEIASAANFSDLTGCGPVRDTGRIKRVKIAGTTERGVLKPGTHPYPNNELVYSNINTSPILCSPLSKEQLKPLLNLILASVSQLPENSSETEYV